MARRKWNWIRRLRYSMNLTQQQFAHALGVSMRTVASWESGQYDPSPLSRERIVELQRSAGGPGHAPS